MQPKKSPKPESFRPLIARGDIEGLSEWIRARRPLRETNANGKRMKSALEVAVDSGFYSMVKLLLEKSIWSDEELDNSLDTALWDRRDDLVKLLIEKGASATRIPFYSVFRTMNEDLIDLFLDLGLDPCKDNAFAKILEETKAKPLLRFFKEKRARFPALEDQMAMALIQAVQNKNVRWSALLIWAGADLRRKAPYDMDSDPADENCYKTTALEEVISEGDMKFMEALKIKPEPEMIGEMLRHASYIPGKPEFKTLLKKMSVEELNSGENGSCEALESLVGRGKMEWPFSNQEKVAQEEEDAIKSIDALLQAGAKWLPPKAEIKSARRRLTEHDQKYMVQVVRLLLYTPGATAIENIWELCRTDSVRIKIQSADRRLWDELLEFATKAGLVKPTSRSRDRESVDHQSDA